MRCQNGQGGITANREYRPIKSAHDANLPWLKQGLFSHGPGSAKSRFSYSVSAIQFVRGIGSLLVSLTLDPRRLRSVCLLLMLLSTRAWAAPAVTLLLSDTGGIYQEAATALQADLEPGGVQVTQQNLSQRGQPRREDWIVVFGVAALQQVMAERGTAPVLSVLVPRASYLRITAGKTRTVTALYLDQPLERMAALQHNALPNRRRTGVLLGSTMKVLREEAEQAAASQRLDIRSREIDAPEEVFPALTELSEDIDVLWLLPDPLVVNRNNLQSLFLQTYRQRLPVVAYSAALVQAGAMLGLYATPTQLGHEAGQWLKTLMAAGERPLPLPRYPVSFVVGINLSVARSLNMTLPTVNELTRLLRAPNVR